MRVFFTVQRNTHFSNALNSSCVVVLEKAALDDFITAPVPSVYRFR